MADVYGKIHKALREMQKGGTTSFFLAEVNEVKGQECTITYDDLVLTGVKLRSVINKEKDMVLLKPAVGSIVLVCDSTEGEYRDLTVMAYSEVEEISVSIGETTMTVTNDEIVLNEGKNGGLVNINELVKKLNAVEQQVNDLKTAFAGWVPAPQDGGASLKAILSASWATSMTPTSVADLEDKKVKH